MATGTAFSTSGPSASLTTGTLVEGVVTDARLRASSLGAERRSDRSGSQRSNGRKSLCVIETLSKPYSRSERAAFAHGIRQYHAARNVIRCRAFTDDRSARYL